MRSCSISLHCSTPRCNCASRSATLEPLALGMHSPPTLDWSSIDTVLLDMDGTLLDLRFDNWFWQEHVPAQFATARGMREDEVRAYLEPKFHAQRGTLDWYCIDYWSRELGLDIPALKRAVRPQ